MHDNSLFWRLPYTVRHGVYKYAKRKNYLRNQKLRLISPRIDQPSLKKFDDFKCIFVHIPKTGGVTINNSYFNSLGGVHRTIKDYQLIFNKKEFFEYFKFAFVRNPWDRLVSTYFHYKRGGFHSNDKEWYKSNLSKYNGFEEFVTEWVNKENINKRPHFKPQHEFITINGEIFVDRIFRFEQFKEAIQEINNKLNLEISIPHLNKSNNRAKDYKSYYSERTKKIVKEVYFEDIEIFKYSF